MIETCGKSPQRSPGEAQSFQSGAQPEVALLPLRTIHRGHSRIPGSSLPETLLAAWKQRHPWGPALLAPGRLLPDLSRRQGVLSLLGGPLCSIVQLQKNASPCRDDCPYPYGLLLLFESPNQSPNQHPSHTCYSRPARPLEDVERAELARPGCREGEGEGRSEAPKSTGTLQGRA